MEGSGRITVNRRRMADYFPALARRMDVLRPFEVTRTLGAMNVMSTVRGGGSTGAALTSYGPSLCHCNLRRGS